ncbi:hypothetical protein [Vibrio sagamiensis]|nr:hypothetical protein [Vibrio sagamiensis]PNQ62839.1 hypothetical protein C1141_10470 [Vibrio agarivorans]
MKMITTLLASLLFASTGAIADTTRLTEQEEQLIKQASPAQMRQCVINSVLSLDEGTRHNLGVLYQSLNEDLQRRGFVSEQDPLNQLITSQEMAMAILVYCKSKLN